MTNITSGYVICLRRQSRFSALKIAIPMYLFCHTKTTALPKFVLHKTVRKTMYSSCNIVFVTIFVISVCAVGNCNETTQTGECKCA